MLNLLTAIYVKTTSESNKVFSNSEKPLIVFNIASNRFVFLISIPININLEASQPYTYNKKEFSNKNQIYFRLILKYTNVFINFFYFHYTRTQINQAFIRFYNIKFSFNNIWKIYLN